MNLHWLLTGEGEMFLAGPAQELRDTPAGYKTGKTDYERIGRMVVEVVAAAMEARRAS